MVKSRTFSRDGSKRGAGALPFQQPSWDGGKHATTIACWKEGKAEITTIFLLCRLFEKKKKKNIMIPALLQCLGSRYSLSMGRLVWCWTKQNELLSNIMSGIQLTGNILLIFQSRKQTFVMSIRWIMSLQLDFVSGSSQLRSLILIFMIIKWSLVQFMPRKWLSSLRNSETCQRP